MDAPDANKLQDQEDIVMLNNVDVTGDALSMQPGQPVEVPSARDEPDRTSEHGLGNFQDQIPTMASPPLA